MYKREEYFRNNIMYNNVTIILSIRFRILFQFSILFFRLFCIGKKNETRYSIIVTFFDSLSLDKPVVPYIKLR